MDTNMENLIKGAKTMYKRIVLIVLMVSMMIMNTSFTAYGEGKGRTREICVNESVIALKYGMQKVWIEHAWWTRSLIVSKIANLEDQKDVLNRLLWNQEDIGNLIKPYYGEGAGNKLTELLKEHIVIAGQIIDAAKSNDSANVEKYNQDWQRNANEIVAFLSSANPYWPKKELTDMFNTHLKLTTDEVVFRLKKNWVGDIRTADRNENHLIEMGDFLSNGIVKQFPEKFQ